MKLSSEQEQFRDSVLRFAREQLGDDLVGLDERREFPREAWARCAEFGIQGLPIPADLGGSDADPVSIALALETLGYACEDNGLLFSLNAQMWACEIPILRYGTPEQRRRYLPGLCDGSLLGGQAITEPGSGSDAFSLTTRAEACEGGYRLSGSKTFVTNAPVADVIVVFASTDPARGFFGVSAFLVERDSPGLTISRPMRTMGLRTSPIGELFLDDCFVPADRVLGRPGQGMPVFTAAMDWERSFILASAVGAMQRLLERSVAHARERHQFGSPIGRFQSVSSKIVDMKLRLETSRLLLYDMAEKRADGRSTALEAALLKLHIGESFVQSSLDAVQIHGGSGYTTELGLERDVRDAIASRIYSGTSEIQRTIVARQLGL